MTNTKKRNQFKNSGTDKTRETSKQPKRKQKTKAKLSNKKLRNVFGVLLIAFGLGLLISFCSYLFTWQFDQDAVVGSSWSELLTGSKSVENWMGGLGVILSHLFMHSWFGLGAFFLALLSLVWGIKILLNVDILPLSQTTYFSVFLTLWLSLTIAFVFGDGNYHLSGGFGYHTKLWFSAVIGKIGLGIFLLVALACFIIIAFNPDLEKIKALVSDFFSKGEKGSEANVILEEFVTPDDEIDLMVEKELTEKVVEEPTELELPDFEEIKETKVTEEENTEDFSIEVVQHEETILSEKEVNKKVEAFGEYDPTLDLSSYTSPKIELLEDHGDSAISIDKEELERNKNNIVETLGNYSISISKIKATVGPTVTLYEIVPAPGVRISKIKNLEDDIALSLAALGIRIIAPIPGKGTIGIEVPNSKPQIVSMRGLIASQKFQESKMELPIALGKTISNEIFIADLAKMPHLLMAGATGQGKSVGLNAILVSLLYKKHPAQIKFVLVDPKKVELTLFNKIERHFLAKLPDAEEAIITDTKKVVNTVNSLCIEMDDRYELLKNAQVRNIKEYNAKFIARKLNPENGHRFLPYIVLVIDEFADLIMTAGKEIETPIARLAQLARAIGIHLIIATQRPSVNIITGTIKANFPARLAFRVTSKIDSRTILDTGGADQLIGRGDMLLSTGSELIRLQCGFVDTPEVDQITEFIGSQRAYPSALLLPEYIDESSSDIGDIDADDRDALFEEAAKIVVIHQQGSASLLQRKLKLGYNRAGRIVDQLEAAGIIGPFEGSKARKVLIPDENSLEQFLNP